jgi:hypothetical protein
MIDAATLVYAFRYEYERVFGPQSTQMEVFDAVQPLCVSILDGYNVCIFAYGQTGSGTVMSNTMYMLQ